MEKNKIFEAVASIIGEVAAVGKTHKNTHQGYYFRSIDDVYNALNPALSKYKVIITPQYSVIRDEVTTNAKGTNQRSVLLQGTYTIYAEDGSNIQVMMFGEAIDTSDKAFNKAMSQAYKYALLQTFCIPTEELKDTEHETPSIGGKAPESNLATEKQIKMLFTIATEKKIPAEEIREIMATDYNKASTKELTKEEISELIKKIEEGK